jgi:hypothetical protein
MNIQQLINKYKKQKATFIKKASLSFKNELLKLAKDIEGLESIKWEQYTPYFNDGEACEFRVNNPSFKFTGVEDAGDYEDGYQDVWSLNYDKKEKHSATKQLEQIKELISSGDLEDILLDMFGDHVEVILDVKSGKFETEEYSHD